VKKLVYMLPVALLMLAITLPVRAQDEGIGGCVDSPENPTVILALVGVAAAGINQLRMRFNGRK
jgi:XrtJ-associated TM-motif-TM protein